MWKSQDSSDTRISDSEQESASEDEGGIQCEILEKERDDAHEKLLMMEKASCQLLKEMDMLEMQFQIERSCRETAEAFALKVTKDYKVLKRKSQAILPLISEIPENLSVLNLEADPDLQLSPDEENAEDPLLLSQNQIKELQSAVDRLLDEKIQLCEQVELLEKHKEDLKEKLMLEVCEKEALLRKLSKQSRTVSKIKRVSQLVTEEFAEMSQKLEMEQGLRQHAEVFAHQMLVKQREAQRQTVSLLQSADTGKQLQQALNQVNNISRALEEIQLCFQIQMKQSQAADEELSTLSDLVAVRTKLEISEKERSNLELQLRDSQQSVTELQEEITQLQDKPTKMEEIPTLKSDQSKEENENVAGSPSLPAPPPPPPPPPLPPLPPSSTVTDPLKVLRNKKKLGDATETAKPRVMENIKSTAVDEMMERIKKGIVLKPVKAQAGSEDENAWKEQRSENRKSAVLELQGMLDCMRRSNPRRVESKKRFSRNVGDAELQMVLQRRRRAIGDDKVNPSSPKPEESPAVNSSPWTGELGSAPVLRRLQHNREKRASRIKASESVLWEEK